MRTSVLLTTVGAGALAFAAAEPAARACGCFAQPNPVQQVVQAAERIVFAQRGPKVEMHVQVTYDGDAEDFGWLLPVPSVPELDVGSDAFFAQLDRVTAPRFGVNFDFSAQCRSNDLANGNGGDGAAPDAGAGNGNGSESPVVSRQDVGAFDAVVLDAEDPDAMFDWLTENEFVVPVGPEDDVIQRYLGAGRFFVALKLQVNRAAGDIQPIVLEFDAGGPMIPITLTQVGAVPDLPVIVHVFGDARAIPRNYRHTVINEEHIDWFSSGSNYVDVVTEAVDEAEGAHSFVTEFAQAPISLDDRLAPDWRFGERSDMEAVTNAAELVRQLQNESFDFDAKLASLLRSFVPYPEQAAEIGLSEDDFYDRIFSSLFDSRLEPESIPVDGAAVAAALWEEIVEPAQRAEALVDDFGMLTRLFTTISPDEMTVDPAFDFNPDLPEVGPTRIANFRLACSDRGGFRNEGWLELPDGRRFFTSPQTWADRAAASPAPFSRRIQAMTLEGPPQELVDNSEQLTPSDPPSAEGGGGCRSVPVDAGASLLLVALGVLVARASARRRA